MPVPAKADWIIGIRGRLAGCLADPRDPALVVHQLEDILPTRLFVVACGCDDFDDLDALGDEQGFRLALAVLPGPGYGARLGCAYRIRVVATGQCCAGW